MGGRSSSTAASTSTNTSTINDHRIAVEAGGFGVASGGSLFVNQERADARALQDGFDAVEKIGTKSFDTLEDVTRTVSDAFGKSNAGALNLAEDIIKDSNKILAEGIEDNAKEIAETAIKYTGVSIAVLAAVMLLRGIK